MADASWPLQQAVFSALSGDATLSAMVSGVFDHVPEGQAFPYVTIGESSAADFSTKTEAGQEHTMTIHAWSRERGRKETKQILARIYDLLHDQALSVAGFTNVLTRYVSAETVLEEDGLTHHGRARYRLITQ